MLPDDIQVSIRRHLAVPAFGIPNTSFTLGIQMYDPYQPPERQAATVETRMQNLTPVEESYLTGKPIAQVALTGIPAANATLTVSSTPLGGTTVALGAHTLTSTEAGSPNALLTFAASMVQAINNGNVPYTAALGPNTPGSTAVAPYASFTIASLTNQTFAISVVPVGVGAYPARQGVAVAMTQVLDNVPVSGLVPILDALEARIAGSSNFAAFMKTSALAFDPLEDVKRQRIYERFRLRLAEFIGVPVDPLGLFSGGGGAIV